MKLAAKLLLARLPIPYSGWRRLSLFKLGAMEDPEYAIRVFEGHFHRSGLAGKSGFTLLEIGPGDSVGSALIASAFGATQVYLVDVGRYARTDLEPYRALAAKLADRGMPVPGGSTWTTFDELLERCNAAYLTDGLAALKQLPAQSVDFIWSQAVLEHVRRREFTATLDEFRRLLKPSGSMSHRIDLQDHLSESLNNLRFSSRLWESHLFRNSGFYTNRLRRGEIIAACRSAGFEPRIVALEKWGRYPIERRALAPEFQHLEDEELLVRAIDLTASAASETASSPRPGIAVG